VTQKEFKPKNLSAATINISTIIIEVGVNEVRKRKTSGGAELESETSQ